ncbi:hypothetical protein HWB57_gp013 [Erwinia phage vB_EamM-Bue1]|uniref:Uncharacterized protein n=1 Tax=Erwinia phage vB_EamM-Bue1 TaxID=2099338 RepID=A0A2P1JU29_9CAUD|nr:hypothetical protein HWB57_gp013 [Erwinia phage vB_EamM-Bue1]AVO22856.1 hypothetical protein [Erwinia phage vB_EamM-Bue1]
MHFYFHPYVTEKHLAEGLLKPKVRFAIIPLRLHDGGWVWFEKYRVAPVGLWWSEKEKRLYQYRVGGSVMDSDDGEYFPRRRFLMNDDSYFVVDDFEGGPEELTKFLEGFTNV